MGPPASVVIATMTVMLAGLAIALAIPAYFLAVGLRRWVGAHARRAGWLVVAAAFAGFVFWIVGARASGWTPMMAYGEELAFAHLAATLAMAGVMLWPRGPLRR